MRYEVWDVFTEAAFGGNPLAVVWEEGAPVSQERRQTVAREFGFSETVFLSPSETADMRVRIFTPTAELPFAGHPTVGTACALAADGRGPEMVLELGVGPIRAVAENGAARFTTEVPLKVEGTMPAETAARCLSVEAADLAGDAVYAGVGLRFALAELRSAEALARCTPDIAAFRAAADDPSRLPLYAFVRDGAEVQARMFQPLGGILEDPATGSAAAALVAYLSRMEGPLALDIRQGVQMGRPSRIAAEARDGAVNIGGGAVKVMEGRLVA